MYPHSFLRISSFFSFLCKKRGVVPSTIDVCVVLEAAALKQCVCACMSERERKRDRNQTSKEGLRRKPRIISLRTMPTPRIFLDRAVVTQSENFALVIKASLTPFSFFSSSSVSSTKDFFSALIRTSRSGREYHEKPRKEDLVSGEPLSTSPREKL